MFLFVAYNKNICHHMDSTKLSICDAMEKTWTFMIHLNVVYIGLKMLHYMYIPPSPPPSVSNVSGPSLSV